MNVDVITLLVVDKCILYYTYFSIIFILKNK